MPLDRGAAARMCRFRVNPDPAGPGRVRIRPELTAWDCGQCANRPDGCHAGRRACTALCLRRKDHARELQDLRGGPDQ